MLRGCGGLCYNGTRWVLCSINKQQKARAYILSSAHVEKEKAKINRPSFRLVNFSKKCLRKIGLFGAVKALISKTKWWNSVRQHYTTKWLTDVANGEYFYQSFPMLNIKGARPTDERIQLYGLYDILGKSMNVLDIGCNTGFFDMTIADCVNSITGIEYDKDFADIAKGTAEILELGNVTFINADANEWLKSNLHNKYSLILSFAVHGWMGITAEDYAQIISELLEPGGYLLFESHWLADGEEFSAEFMKHNMKRLRGGLSGGHRIWALFQKAQQI